MHAAAERLCRKKKTADLDRWCWGSCCTELDQFWFHQLLCRVS